MLYLFLDALLLHADIQWSLRKSTGRPRYLKKPLWQIHINTILEGSIKDSHLLLHTTLVTRFLCIPGCRNERGHPVIAERLSVNRFQQIKISKQPLGECHHLFYSDSDHLSSQG